MYTLYGFKGSGSAAIEMALTLTEAPCQIVDAASWEPDSALQKLAELNPLKQIPTLVLPDGSILTESAAILIQLGLDFPSSGLLPAQPELRAQAIRGLVYISANCYSLIGIIDYPERLVAGEDDAFNEIVRKVQCSACITTGIFSPASIRVQAVWEAVNRTPSIFWRLWYPRGLAHARTWQRPILISSLYLRESSPTL